MIISGTDLSKKLRLDLAEEVLKLKEKGITPSLAVILVGENPASISYVTGKEKAASAVGMDSFTNRLDASVTEDELLSIIDEYNNDESKNTFGYGNRVSS